MKKKKTFNFTIFTKISADWKEKSRNKFNYCGNQRKITEIVKPKSIL